jgi:hypothetical protein
MYDLTNKRPRRKRQEWQSLVDAFTANPTDMKSFCEAQSIRPDRLRFWLRRLKTPTFVELPKIVDPATTERDTWDVELTLGQDVTLRLRSH